MDSNEFEQLVEVLFETDVSITAARRLSGRLSVRTR